VAPEIIYMATWGRADALALGGLCALFVRRADWRVFGGRARAMVVTVTLAALAAVAVASHDFARKQAATQIAGYSVLAAAFAIFIAAAVIQSATGGGRLVRALSFPPLRAIGRVSYGMYLFHLPLHLLATRLVLARFLDRDGNTTSVAFAFVYLIVATAVLYGLALLSWTRFERRFRPPRTSARRNEPPRRARRG
jgi:peptidoglycan/LPS O-acetylase OafA/YrhL